MNDNTFIYFCMSSLNFFVHFRHPCKPRTQHADSPCHWPATWGHVGCPGPRTALLGGIHGHVAAGQWPAPWLGDLTRSEHDTLRWPLTQGTRLCLGRHSGTRHGTSTININYWCSYDLYICAVNYYIYKNDKIFQYLVKILIKMSYCRFDGPWTSTTRRV
jgi:hypothetical protein